MVKPPQMHVYPTLISFLARALQSTLNFHTTESTSFWHKIPPKPGSTRKVQCKPQVLHKLL